MAYTAKKLHTAEQRMNAELIAMKGTEDSVDAANPKRTDPIGSSIARALQDGIERGICVVKDANQSVGHTFRGARDRARDAYRDLSYKSRYLTRHLGDRAQRFKQERPLQLLAVIAGTAFVVGVFVRVWRSRPYEH